MVHLLEVLPRFLQVAAAILDDSPDHQVAELPHDIIDGATFEIAAVAFRANELAFSRQRDEPANDEVDATRSPLTSKQYHLKQCDPRISRKIGHRILSDARY